MNEFERISDFLRYEKIPKTPQEISVYTGIKLGMVYNILQENKVFFKEIIVDDSLKGWVINAFF